MSSASWDALSVILAKRDGRELPPEAMRWFVEAYTNGQVADEQAAAMCMAVFFNGMSAAELSAWTEAMIDSGTRTDLSAVNRPLVDKHSTGGVGDKISLILCPLVAACGAAMPQVAGRALGHTGGTIDKMEAIPGWDPHLGPEALLAALNEVGAVITAASADLAPADAKLYALRDVTGTVASIPLIASSIMSKKIASGTASLVLDVKVGRGAFMTDLDQARRLAETMVDIGTRAGVKTTALLTRMDQPLGRAVGNSLEVDESIDVLHGGGPTDVVAVTVALATEMLELAGIDADPGAVLASGVVHEVFAAMVARQGGDVTAPRARAPYRHAVAAPSSGFVTAVNALTVGQASGRLGAGRARKEDDVDLGAGIEVLAPVGTEVEAGQPLFLLHSANEQRMAEVNDVLTAAVEIGPEPPDVPDVVIERIA
ncbi:MAG: thymidine phosphorylase [Actinomycetota bacterium]